MNLLLRSPPLRRLYPGRGKLFVLHLPGALLVCAALAGEAASPAPAVVGTLAELQGRLRQHLEQPRFAPALWGCKIVSLDTGNTLFETNSGKLLKPASNAKLFSGALALARLGPDFRIRTSLYTETPPDTNGMVGGDLVVYGRGDPSFAARFYGGNHGKSLERLVRAVTQAGIREVRGDLVGDETYFVGPRLGSSWAWEDLQEYYGAEVSALSQEDNVIDLSFSAGARVGDPCRILLKPPTDYLAFSNVTRTVPADGQAKIDIDRPPGTRTVRITGTLPLGTTNRAGAVSVPDPALWFVVRLKEELARAGIRVAGRPRTLSALRGGTGRMDRSRWVEVAATESFPLRELVSRMMKPSQNLYAQLLLLQVGARAGTRAATTEVAGLDELRKFLREIGVDPDEVRLDEGSGLSRRALVTPNAIVGLLRAMARHPHASVFLDSLPVAGVDGTLRNRMKGSKAEGNGRAKTGTIGFVNSLSGHVTTAAGERLAFSLLLNGYDSPSGAPEPRQDLDAVVRMLAEFTGRTTAGGEAGLSDP